MLQADLFSSCSNINAHAFTPDMNGVHLSLLLACVVWVVQSHIVLEEKQEKFNTDSIVRFPEILQPISIIDLKKSSWRVSRADAEKNKLAKAKKKNLTQKKARIPPPSCVPLKSSCRPPAPPCCEPCAFCHCHIFQTVCIYKMGYPYC
ncbi:agouti-signaling protein-like isoform X2 [Eleutherodactylus coqui]|uniref:agouti-signaling protein-like isoform X2 n=1 Tax=Eleutherodactylus coqui TaxID=57060 RepID=UPI003461B126